MVKKSIFSVIIILALAGCSIGNPLSSARNFQRRNNYVAAIEQYDSYLRKADNLELITIAEIQRAECYYMLGMRAVEKENWELASKLFYLSNSEEADKELDLSYIKLAEKAFSQKDSLEAILNYQKIKDFLPNSEYREEALIKLITYYHNRGDDSTAFDNYLILNKEFSNSDSLTIMGQMMNSYVLNKAGMLYTESQEQQDESNIEEMKMLLDLKLPAEKEISNLIANLYKKNGDNSYQNSEYVQAFDLYNLSISYNKNLEDYYQQQKQNYISLVLEKADKLVQEGLFEDAIEKYDYAFEIFPENDQIQEAKLVLNRQIYNADLAEKAFEKGEAYYELDDFSNALVYYSQSYSYLKTKEVLARIKLMENLIKADSDPKGFALEIVEGYQRGLLAKKINETFNSAHNEYGVDMVENSGWKVLFYTGKYKYEVRNDILTPGDSFYFAWMVDLTKREIIPLNKISENLLEGINPYEN